MEVESYRPDLEVVAGEDLPNPARVAAGVVVAVHHPEEVEVVEAEFLLFKKNRTFILVCEGFQRSFYFFTWRRWRRWWRWRSIGRRQQASGSSASIAGR